MSDANQTADDITLPIKRTTGDTLEERLSSNAYHNILPARYLQKDADGNVIEEQEELFERVAKNVALAEAVYEAERLGLEVTVTPAQLKPTHPRRDDLAAEVFGAGTTADDDVETALTEDNVNKFAYETVVPALPAEVRTHVESVADEFQELMEELSFIPNSPTLMNAGGELQQLSACFVMSPDDDISDIHETAKKAAEVFQCLTDATHVVERDKGVISIADVEPGDAVLQRSEGGHRFGRVFKTLAYEDAPVRSLELEAGFELTGTPNHRLLVDDEWREIRHIEPGDRLPVRLDWLEDVDLTPQLRSVDAGDQWSRRRTVSNDAIATLHADGLTDYEIAKRLDVSPSTVQRRRADELDLPPNGTGGRPPGRRFDEDRFLDLYEAGYSDREIAHELGASKPAVRSFRTAQRLEPNGRAVKTVTQPDHLSTDLAELLGLWIGDGSIHGDGIRFHVSNEEVLETIDRRSRDLFDTGVDWTWAEGAYEVVIHSHEIKRWWLENFGDSKPSSATARVPDIVWKADRDTAGAFLRGLFTADGTLTKGTYPRLYSASEELVRGSHQLLLGLGIPTSVWAWDNADREYFSIAPVGEPGVTAFAERVGFVDDRQERLERSIDERDFRPMQTGRLVDDRTWELAVVDAYDAGTATVYDINVPDRQEYLADGIVSHNSGGGVGYGFWKLRPFGDSVGSTGGIASGPITFMRTFDQLCETIAQGGTRRGAQMAIMRVSHPDVIEFIHAKNKDVSLAHTLKLNDPDDYTYTTFSEALEEARDLIDEEGRVPKHLRNAVEGHLSNFNISVGVTDGFMEALKNGEDYTFTNPRTGEDHVATEETKEMYARYGLGEYVTVGEALTLPAEIIWDRIIEGAHENGEPGVVFLERVNKEHSFDVEEHPDHRILATNPCGEQPLEEYEACNLGHINLSTLAAEDAPDWRVWSAEHADDYPTQAAAVEAFLEEAVDWEDFDRRIELATRFLENVVTMSDFPVEEITETVRRMRKIGLGIMGLAQLYIQLGMKY
ncbi:MAG: ribonucleotide reductase N-terminal alpha domain-containing protein, partial [Halobacteriales archaeon]